MGNKSEEVLKKNDQTQPSVIIDQFLIEVRQAFADYQGTEGCGCCSNVKEHLKAEERLGKLLGAKPYDDNSGFDWSVYRSS